MADYKDEIKEKAGEYADDLKDAVGEITGDAKGAINDVKEEAKEVFEEAKATFTGQKLDSANVEGGAGYRADSSTNNGVSVAALILGVLAIICSFFGRVAIAGVVLGLIGTVLGAKARKQSQTSMATVGFVCGIVSVIVCVLRIIF